MAEEVRYAWIRDIDTGGDSYRCLEVFDTLAAARAQKFWSGNYVRLSRSKWRASRIEKKTVTHIDDPGAEIEVTIYKLVAR